MAQPLTSKNFPVQFIAQCAEFYEESLESWGKAEQGF